MDTWEKGVATFINEFFVKRISNFVSGYMGEVCLKGISNFVNG